MVSGYARPYRLNKPLAFIHAYIDDSVSQVGKRRLFMAGFMNRAEAWALFADAWAEELKAHPKIEYLKMAEAQGLKGQFKGWRREDVDEKLRGLARVISHFKPVSFEFTVDCEDYIRIVKPASPRGLGNPYFSCSLAVISGLSRAVAQHKGKTPIKFIFDRQDGVDDDVRLAFESLKEQLPKRARELISGEPSFEDDKLVTPLQAADMIAWHLRRAAIDKAVANVEQILLEDKNGEPKQ